jgi:hypothetical protein
MPLQPLEAIFCSLKPSFLLCLFTLARLGHSCIARVFSSFRLQSHHLPCERGLTAILKHLYRVLLLLEVRDQPTLHLLTT